MKTLLAILSIILIGVSVSADQIELSGDWKFQIDMTNSGLDNGWEKADFDDSSWKTIKVPATWESQGITEVNPEWEQSDDLKQPYTGYAWYRRTVQVPSDWQGKFDVFLNLGPIDDNDWTYLNGKLIGSTTERNITVSGMPRSYKVPDGLINYGGGNVIAVRVLDFRGLGGITQGPVNLSNEPISRAGSAPDKVRTGGSITVEKGETVGDAVAVLGSVIIKGHVTGDAVAVMGNVRVQPGAVIDGDAVAVGGTVTKDQGAIVRGSTSSIGFRPAGFLLPRIYGHVIPGIYGAWVSRIVAFLAAVLFALVAAVIVALFPSRMEMIAMASIQRPGMSALYGLLGVLLIVPIAVLLVLTCIGIPLIAVEFVAIFALWLVGKAGICLVLGRKSADAINHPVASGVWAAVIGALLIAFIEIIPFAGTVAVLVLDLIGFGAVLVTRFGSRSDWMPENNGVTPSA